jgi:pimeloyl-ACP methyl ester carboxylesterase
MTNPAPLAGTDGVAIRPFHVGFPDADLVELRRRVRATRWPDRELVAGDTQGVPLALVQELAKHWASDYDWRRCEAQLNALPQFITEIDGVDIHFIRVRSKHEPALPMIVTHGWPGSVIEQLKIIGPLTDPTAHGASAADAFDLVIPSMPGFGFSGRPTTTGWGPDRIARAWTQLMKRLGYSRFVAQGGDWGSGVCEEMALQAPPELLGIHVNLPATVPPEVAAPLEHGQPAPADLGSDERIAYDQIQALFAKHRAYAQMMGTRPQTLSGMADSPIGLAAWLLDHADANGQPAAVLAAAVMGGPAADRFPSAITRDDVLDNITLYWLANTGVSAGRIYWENKFNLYDAADIHVPAAVSVFPGENYQAPRSWAERAYSKLVYYNRPAAGGHFAAWEQPQIFSEEVRSGFRPMRAMI